MLVVGLTGGIGSGKTAVSDRFAKLGVPVIDADILSRELVTPGQPALAEITATFGPEVISENGELNRKSLGEIVFSDPARRKELEAILHSRIRAAMRSQLAKLRAPYVILVIPLLLETGQKEMVDRILLVDTPPDLQRRRIQARDGFSRERIEQIFSAQTSREDRLAAADDVIVNDRDLPFLDQSVSALHTRYMNLSSET